jgi:ubiquinone/menaquinone biosynthesis C-methylase UbiE
MTDSVAVHYGGRGDLVEAIAAGLRKAGKNLEALRTSDLAAIDEFHIRGRQATLELAGRMGLDRESHVLDIGSGLGGPARTVAETYGCHVTGVDLTEAFCDAATVLSQWVGLGDRVAFRQGDATELPFADHQFDAAMTLHVAMNIPIKNRMYEQARRVVKPGGVFAAYDVLQGEGGDALLPSPWARERSINHLATAEEMERLLAEAGFTVLEVHDSTDESEAWFERVTERMARVGPPPVSLHSFLGDDFPEMARNQSRNLAERRIRTVSYICEA